MSEDVLERADQWVDACDTIEPSVLETPGVAIVRDLIFALAAEVRELRKDRERAKSEIEKAVELIQRWGCECEPMIGFTCGPCRVVEMIDAALAAAKGE